MEQQATEPRVLVNRKGQSLTTHMTDAEAFKELERQVTDGEQAGFAFDLILKGKKYGLSQEQFWWVHKLAEPKVLIDADHIVNTFHKARDNGVKQRSLKTTVLADGVPVVLSLAGPRSKYKGDIWVTDDGDYPGNTIFGRIGHESGVFEGKGVPEAVAKLIDCIQMDPESYLPW